MFSNPTGGNNPKLSRHTGSEVVLTRNSKASQVPGVKEARKLLPKQPKRQTKAAPRGIQAEIAMTAQSLKGKVVAVHGPRQRIPELRNLIFGVQAPTHQGPTLLVQGMPPVLELGVARFPNGSVIHNQKRYVLEGAHNIRDGLSLHEVKEVVEMRSQEVPDRLVMRTIGDEIALLRPGVAEQLPGHGLELRAYAPDSPQGKALIKAGELMLRDQTVRSVGTRALAGTQLSEVIGFTVMGGHVVFGHLSRKSDQELYCAGIKDFTESMQIGQALWNKLSSLRKQTNELYQKKVRLTSLDEQLQQLQRARSITAKRSRLQMQEITALAQELGLPVPEVAVSPVSDGDLIDRMAAVEIADMTDSDELPDSGDELLADDFTDGL